jgi:hypothetical protein
VLNFSWNFQCVATLGGLIVFFVVMALYLGSLVLRNRSLKQDLASLEEMDKE